MNCLDLAEDFTAARITISSNVYGKSGGLIHDFECGRSISQLAVVRWFR